MIRILASVGVTLLLVGGIALAQSRMYSEREAQNKARAQIPVAGASANFSPTAASASGSQLSSNTVYMITCSQDAHIRWNDAGATCTAVATDFLLTAGTIIYWATGPYGEADIVCGIRDAVDGVCYTLEVR